MKKDLQYYLTHTDEMPTDPAEIERLANEHMSQSLEGNESEMSIDRIVEKEDEIPGEPSDAKTVEEEPKAKADEPKEEESTEEPKPEGILAKDGKNVIPYSQLESARQRATEAERLLAEQTVEIERLKAEKVKPESKPDVETLTDDELNALAEDSPTLAKVLRAQQSVIKKLNETVEELAERSERDQTERVENVKSEVQQAIDSTPELAAWQTDKDQTMWDRAAAFDKTLRELPEYKEIPFTDRFKKVVALTKAAFTEESEPEDKTPTLTPEEIKAVAKQKLSQATKKAVPRSLSDIPGGAPPAVDEKQKVEQMSSVALGQQFLGMTREQLDAYLSGL